MENLITYKGIIHFDPVNVTRKHKNQADWKRMALVLIDGELCEYYAWFIKKRYSIELNRPLRGAHISFLNDSVNDMMKGLKCTEQEAEIIWNSVKNKYDGKEIDIVLNVDVRGNNKHYWFNIPEEFRTELHNIRLELGLSRPYFGLHMSIGTTRSGIHEEHANYIQRLLRNGIIQ
jgi:hypothetical protein